MSFVLAAVGGLLYVISYPNAILLAEIECCRQRVGMNLPDAVQVLTSAALYRPDRWVETGSLNPAVRRLPLSPPVVFTEHSGPCRRIALMANGRT